MQGIFKKCRSTFRCRLHSCTTNPSCNCGTPHGGDTIYQDLQAEWCARGRTYHTNRKVVQPQRTRSIAHARIEHAGASRQHTACGRVDVTGGAAALPLTSNSQARPSTLPFQITAALRTPPTPGGGSRPQPAVDDLQTPIEMASGPRYCPHLARLRVPISAPSDLSRSLKRGGWGELAVRLAHREGPCHFGRLP